MNGKIYRLPIAQLLLAALAMPAAIQAQITGDIPITILQTTDLHHHANGSDHVGLDLNPVTAMGITGAYARISAYVSYVRATAGHPVVLVDSGDWTMGTLYDLTLASRPLALSFINLMGYDCIALGNHEFDYSPVGLGQMLKAAQSSFGFHTPIVASNMNLGGSPDLTPFSGAGKLIQTTYVEQLPNGLKIGYIGLMGKAAALSAPVSAPVTFSDFSAANYSALQALVNNLRNTQGVQVVIALSHSGTDATGTTGEDVALAQNVTGIDVIASGHTHTPLSSAHTVTNAGWNTRIVDAGAYSANVSRIDITYHSSTKSTTMDASANPSMTDATLASLNTLADPAIASVVGSADLQLNATLGPYFKQTFSDYDPTNIAKGIYHPVGTTAQDMVSNDLDPVPSPNGLGDLSADAVRNIPNAIIGQTLAAVGGNPANLPGYDFTPFQAGVVATGVLRNKLVASVPLSFADIYNVMPLGISPDSTQSLPVGYPLVSAYLELADVTKLCALQLIAQTTLASGDYYLNFSGFKYGLKTTGETYTYFKYATAAAVLQLIIQKATSGNPSAVQALTSLLNLPSDNGQSLLAAYALDNPYAGAVVTLNDVAPTSAQIFANLGVIAAVGTAALEDSIAGTNTASTLVVSKAIAAIDTISAFAANDAANTGSTTPLTANARVRVATDLFGILALGSVQTQFGVSITVYSQATGSTTLSGANLGGILANRINAVPSSASIQELKAWSALLSYLATGLNGSVTSAYASTSVFTQFPVSGAAVQTRNSSYPLPSIGQFISSMANLEGTPLCAGAAAPAIAAVTNLNYGSSVSAPGTVVIWGSGFSPSGGNAVTLNGAGGLVGVSLNLAAGNYFWDLSPGQINAAIPQNLSGTWVLTVRNACGATSPPFSVMFP
jgi:2',3'-cyclic-nucleotide 2'-phosphodiesterase (5'-nucleotidase family)